MDSSTFGLQDVSVSGFQHFWIFLLFKCQPQTMRQTTKFTGRHETIVHQFLKENAVDGNLIFHICSNAKLSVRFKMYDKYSVLKNKTNCLENSVLRTWVEKTQSSWEHGWKNSAQLRTRVERTQLARTAAKIQKCSIARW